MPSLRPFHVVVRDLVKIISSIVIMQTIDPINRSKETGKKPEEMASKKKKKKKRKEKTKQKKKKKQKLTKYIEVQTATRWTIRHGLMRL